MSNKQLRELMDFQKNLLALQRAPSQLNIFYHLLLTGKTMTVKEIASEIGTTEKSIERAMSKLNQKGLVERSPFKEGSYTVDSKKLLGTLLLSFSELQLENNVKNR